jgi:hypothetical protein
MNRSSIAAALFGLSLMLAGCSRVSTGAPASAGVSPAPAVREADTGLLDPQEIGLPLYSGAQPANLPTGENAGETQVSAPALNLKIAAAKFTTLDSADKVLAFYRQELARFGKVDQSLTVIGPLFLHHFSWKGSSGQTALTAGDPDDLHMVLVDPQPQGCMFALVLIDRRPRKIGPI